MSQPDAINGHDIGGAAKAAAFLLLIGPDNAKRLAEFFSEEELRAIFSASEEVHALTVGQLRNLAEDFHSRFSDNGFVKSSGFVESLFSGMRPDINFLGGPRAEADPAQETASAGDEREPDWDSLRENGEDGLKAFLQEQHPQAGAFVLSSFDQAFSARILRDLEGEIRREIMVRMADLSAVEGKMALKVARLAFRHLAPQGEEGEEGGHEDMRGFAGIVNQLPKETADEVLEFLAARNERKAELVRKWMFRFEAVEGLSRDARARLFDRFSAEELAMALAGASDGLKECVMSVVSQRNRRSIEAELQEPAFGEEQTNEARLAIANTALQLAHEGVISLEPESETPEASEEPEAQD